MLVTLCTLRQLSQALVLADSFVRHTDPSGSQLVVIGLADDPAHLPDGFVSPYPIVPISSLIPADTLASLSAMYTPTEFAAACKPLLLTEAFRRYPAEKLLVYADPNGLFMHALQPMWDGLGNATLLLTPMRLHPPVPDDPRPQTWPDEKYFQNVGLYSTDLLVVRRSAETDRFLTWWDDRVRTRAFIDFCAGLCLDQLWLMHVPVFFRNVRINKQPGWQVALWNLPERPLANVAGDWTVSPSAGNPQPVLFLNVKGLQNPGEGLFTELPINYARKCGAVTTLLETYRSLLAPYKNALPNLPAPAYGTKPEPVVLRGWRRRAVRGLRTVTHFLNTVYLPPLR